MANLSVKDVRKSFGAVEVIKGVDLEISQGELVVIVGPSGCGKSTMLRMIAGLEEITSGEMYIGEKLVNDLTPAKRGIAMVFQSYALYPHMNVFDNMAFGLKLAKVEKSVIDRKILEVAQILRLEEYLDRLPRHLSGGQRQRVAIGRAIVRDPKIFLFDEPLSNLDAALRVATRIEISKLHDSMPDATMIFVTHDQVEAMTLADRIVVLRAGIVEQIGTPKEVYHNPSNLFVAQFIGSPAMNVVDCKLESGSPNGAVSLANGNRFEVAAQIGTDQVGKPGKMGVRPEHLKLGEADGAIFSGRIELVEFLGDVTIVHLDIGLPEHILAKIDGSIDVSKNQNVHLTADPSEIHVFDSEGNAFRRK